MIYFICIIFLNHALSLDLSERCITRFDFVTFTGLRHFNESINNDGCYSYLSSNRQTFVDHTIPDINRKDSEIILSHNAIENISFVNSSRFWNLNYFAIDHNHLSAFQINEYLMFSTEIILVNNNQIRIVLLDCTWISLLKGTDNIAGHVKLLDLSWNFISSIEYYNCKFDHLKLHHNLFINDDILNIEDFHVERLDLSFNYISKLNFKTPNMVIRHFLTAEHSNLLGNPFTSHAFYPKPLAQLKELYLENLDRSLEYLNYGQLDQLQILYVFKLVLRTRYIRNASYLSDSKELTHLNSTLLELTVIQPDNSGKLFAIIVTTRWIKLKKLHLQNFELYSLNCSLADQVPELRVLSLIESDIHFIKTSLDIIPSTLEILNLSGNPLKYLDLTNIRNLYNLRIIDISDVISFDSGTTEYLNISNTSIPSVLIKNLTNLVVLCLNSKGMRIDSLQFNAKLKSSFLINPYNADCPADILQIKQFSSAVIEQYEERFDGYPIFIFLVHIRLLSIRNGMITYNRIPHFRFLRKLQIFKIVECSLINDFIDLSNKGHLNKIILHKTAVNFQPEKFCSGNILLKTLNISSGGIKNLPSTLFKHCSQLTNLILSSNEIREVDSQFEEFYNNNLQLLDLSNNFISTVDLKFVEKCILLHKIDLTLLSLEQSQCAFEQLEFLRVNCIATTTQKNEH
ncbi:hypothetical protein GJ496_007835 [Pomphorhynchus laevis]|nr:hypothetical protein GJ496_007835 [Pomphorhynchus laevis]